MTYNILLIGSGGREHALAKKISESPLCNALITTPGNPGTAMHGQNVSIDYSDADVITNFIKVHDINMVVIGPEQPLVEGLADLINLKMPNVIVVGPSAEGAQLEGSKAYAKAFMQRHGIPTASYFECTSENIEAGLRHLETTTGPYVLKADGLAAGKGVLIIDELEEAQRELKSMVMGKFGEASSKVVIEEFLDGIEFSVFALTDGKDYILLPEAKDYKRIGEGDTGLNTGGMGAVSPVSFADENLWNKVKTQIIEPTVAGLKSEKITYNGFIFFGLINVDGQPKVIEYNCRLGDPETEVVLPRLESDLVEAFAAMGNNTLDQYQVRVSNQSAATIILVSGGYPEAYERGYPIHGINDIDDSIVYHAGTKNVDEGVVTNGGRVLAITSLDKDFRQALATSNKNALKITFEGKYFRRDIGFDL